MTAIEIAEKAIASYETEYRAHAETQAKYDRLLRQHGLLMAELEGVLKLLEEEKLLSPSIVGPSEDQGDGQ